MRSTQVMNSLGESFVKRFKQNQPQETTPQLQPQAPLSNKMGVNKKKTTQLQQGIINNMINPQQQQEGM